ncbi:MAG: D-erythronate dehydrogenase [Pseudomonadota bacterium]|nr:D-erythronate dehydrogenase [Pseudomonadota bacterium]
MRVLIMGAAGMVGQKLLSRLENADTGLGKISKIYLHDMVPANTASWSGESEVLVGNIAESAEMQKLADLKPDLIFHLASIVSGEAELEFVKGWQVNMAGSWMFLEALRQHHEDSGGSYVPKMVFTSSIAVFGAPFPDKISDEFFCAPQTSYGAQKAIIELLISDYSRKGYIDGISIRLPTICVRPGKPNLAASSFFSGIIREPLNGVEAILPVKDDVRHWHASPRSAARFLTHAASMDLSVLGSRRALNMPGVSCTVAEQIEALRTIAGNDVVSLIRPQLDDHIVKIVAGWPRNFDTERSVQFGFESESSFEEIIKIYLEDDLPKASG